MIFLFLSIHRNSISLESDAYILPCLGSFANLVGWVINVAWPVMLGISFVSVSSPTRLQILQRKDSGSPQMTYPWHPQSLLSDLIKTIQTIAETKTGHKADLGRGLIILECVLFSAFRKMLPMVCWHF